ncbi:MAG TPA: FtsK/SpoIIIE domain-containing protein [Nocardioides sp.]
MRARLRGLQTAAAELADDARRIAWSEHHQAEQAYAAARAGGKTLSSADDAVAQAVRRAASTSTPVVRRTVETLAPGLAALPPDSPGWRSREFVGAGASTYVRLGELDIEGLPDPVADPLPVLAPLLGTTGWRVNAPQPTQAHRLLQALALRQVACAEPFRVRVDSFDPHLTGSMGLLGNLSAKYPQLVPKALHAPSALEALLSALTEESSARAARLAQAGHSRFDDLVRETGRVTDPYRLVLLFDYPAGVDANAQRDLLRLAATGAERGITFVVAHNPAMMAERDVDPGELLDLLETVSLGSAAGGDRLTLTQLPDVLVKPDPAFDAETAAAVCDLVAHLAERAVLPTIDFADTLPENNWQPVRDELDTVIGYDDRAPVRLRLRTSNPALPHALVGGAVGQGKSNLLLVLIHGLAARYAPHDLEMYLLDFKHGVEFASLGPGPDQAAWLPHARVLGVHSDRAFGLAVLRHLSDELGRRSELFKARGLADISDFSPGPERPPRVLVVLDEFQVLLEDDDELADEAARLLERLARLGRAYGVHLVLATQTIEGVARLATRRDSIFGQVPYRIALKTTPTDSQAILRTGNTAAAELQFRGEAILNQNFGSPDDNQRILVSFADKDTLAALRAKLWTRARALGTTAQPRVFHLGEPARLSELVALDEAPPTGGIRVWAGLPIAVTEQPVTIEVRPEPGAGVLVLGDGGLDAVGVLSGLAVAVAAATRSTPARFLLLDGLAGDPSLDEPRAALASVLTRLGAEVEIVDRAEEIHERIFGLRDELAQGGPTRPTYVLGVGLHAVPRMKAFPDGRYESPADALTEVVRDGPASGLVTFGWWNRLHVCTDQLGYNRANVAAHVFLRHPLDGVRAVCGPLARWASEPYRALVWDGLNPEPITAVAFAPLGPGDVDPLVERVVG